MLAALRAATDRLLGRGSAAITVPVMDGALRPNRALDQAELVAVLDGIDDIASDGHTLWASAGPVLWRLDGGQWVEAWRGDADISALAAHASGRLALAVGGRRILLLPAATPGASPLATLEALAGQPLVAVNALAFDGPDALVFSDGSSTHGPAQWCHDLMALGRSGRVGRWQALNGAAGGPAGQAGQADLVAHDLRYAYGVLPGPGGALRVSESWQHRVLSRPAGQNAGRNTGRSPALLSELPGYPSRMAMASAGGFWLTCFVCRTQLVEFVLREPAYRQRMVAEIAPQHWIAPALSSGHSFLEPLQGAGVKNMGVLKPWAPPRSYGLVIHVADDGRILRSLHSQVDGRHHGITAVVEHAGALHVASKGSGRLLKVPLQGMP